MNEPIADVPGVDAPSRQVDNAGRLQSLLTEYQWLRQESIASISNRITVMNFTFAAMSVVVGGLLTRQVPDLLGAAVALLVVPQCAKAGLLIWLGEYRRNIRASQWTAVLEAKVDAATGAPGTMEWERNLKLNSLHMRYPYVAVVMLLLGVSYLSSLLGVYLLYAGLRSVTPEGTGAAITGGALVVCSILLDATFLAFFRARWRECSAGMPASDQG